jgi:[NiFe] hydrogenase assembly HybE family chaperone
MRAEGRAVASRASGAAGDGPALARRLHALEAAFRHIQTTRMQGLGLLNERLRVQAVGFEALPSLPTLDDPIKVAGGVLVTPWFINLILLPLGGGEAGIQAPVAALETWPAPGQSQVRAWGNHSLSFVGAHEAQVGPYALCSLFSPVHNFIDQAVAVATALQVLEQLRPDPPAAPALQAPGRRGFLFGRSAAVGRA